MSKPVRWDDPQPPFDWEEFRELMLRALRAPRYPRTAPIRASLYRALQRKYLSRDLYAALGLNR